MVVQYGNSAPTPKYRVGQPVWISEGYRTGHTSRDVPYRIDPEIRKWMVVSVEVNAETDYSASDYDDEYEEGDAIHNSFSIVYVLRRAGAIDRRELERDVFPSQCEAEDDQSGREMYHPRRTFAEAIKLMSVYVPDPTCSCGERTEYVLISGDDK